MVWAAGAAGPGVVGGSAAGDRRLVSGRDRRDSPGREREVVELESRLRQRETEEPPTAFVAVIGASGSGKSSLVRAGLRANLTRFNLDETVSEWSSGVMMPAQSEGNPVAHLLDCLTQPGALPELAQSGIPLAEIAQNLAENPKPTVNLTIKPALRNTSFRPVPQTSGEAALFPTNNQARKSS